MALKKVKRIWKKSMWIVKDYCLNSSLAGLRYIADRNYHFTERVFWLACLILSWWGSYQLIAEYMDSYFTNSVSMGVKSMRPQDTSQFPSVGFCELGYSKEIYADLEELIEKMRPTESIEYNYDVEDFLLRVIFHNLYNFGSMSSYCAPYFDCDDCVECPKTGYEKFANTVRANCSELMIECSWNNIPFDCCKYFKPLKTTMGICFLLNSIQTVKKGGKFWLDMTVGFKEGNGLLQIRVSKSAALYILNEEDIPHMLLTTLYFPQVPEGYDGNIFLTIQNTINDASVRNIEPDRRHCIFPDEFTQRRYPSYSYSTCVTECLKKAQIQRCNCTHYNMVLGDDDPSPQCEYDGLLCLDTNDLMFPQTTIMQPWRTNGLVCQCYPSCSENEIKVVGRNSKIRHGETDRFVSIQLQATPTQKYYRQAVREELDIVVSVGGILGLFMGASILSLVEFVYFMTVRICNSTYDYDEEDEDEENDDEDEEDNDDDDDDDEDKEAKY